MQRGWEARRSWRRRRVPRRKAACRPVSKVSAWPWSGALARAKGSARRPFLGSERLHRQRMDLRAHAIAQRCIDELVLAHSRQPREARTHDDCLEMGAVALHLDVRALE